MFLPRRLDKYLKDASLLSLSELRAAILAGRVAIVRGGAARPAFDNEILVFEDYEVRLDGAPLRPRTVQKTVLFFKPRSVTTTTRDPRGKQDLSAWLSKMPPGVFPVGRLDRETTGALLLTTDGDLANALLHPDHGASKIYSLFLSEVLTEEDARLKAFVRGIETALGLMRAEEVCIETRTEDYTLLRLTLGEGKNRQIRRMCRALDLRLLHLHRRSIAGLTLSGLQEGEFRELSETEVDALFSTVGGRERIWGTRVQALRQSANSPKLTSEEKDRLRRFLQDAEVAPDPTSGAAAQPGRGP